MNEGYTRYKPGGDIYANVLASYGAPVANQVAYYAGNYDDAGIQNTLENARHGVFTGSESTFVNFLDQVTTDPLAAPLESANKVIGNTFASLFKNPWVLIVGVTALALWLVGPDKLKKLVGL